MERPAKRPRLEVTIPDLVISLCRKGNYRGLNQIFEGISGLRTDLVRKCFKTAVKNGHVNVILVLMENIGIDGQDRAWAISRSLQDRRLDVLQSIVGPEYFSDYDHHGALRFAHTSMLWYFLHEKLDGLGPAGMYAAGQFGCLEYFQKHKDRLAQNIPFTGAAVAFVASGGNLHIIKWLLDQEDHLFSRIMETGLLESSRIAHFIRLIVVIDSDNLVRFKEILNENHPDWRWANVIRSVSAASMVQLCIQSGAEKIFDYLVECLYDLTLISNEKPKEIPSILYLMVNISSAINQILPTQRQDWLRKVLLSQMPADVSKQFLLLEALPEALGISVLDSMILLNSSCNAEERKAIYDEIGYGLLVTKVEVLHNLAVAIQNCEFNRVLVFMDVHPEIQHLHKEIWERIFLRTDIFINLINKLS